MIANTPKPPYFAVIFTSTLKSSAHNYEAMAKKMVNLAQKQKGFLGLESVREELGITVSYWKDEESIKSWKQQTDHLMAQKLGKEQWYKTHKVRICYVTRDYPDLSK